MLCCAVVWFGVVHTDADAFVSASRLCVLSVVVGLVWCGLVWFGVLFVVLFGLVCCAVL
jgi:hypothetical protein